MPPNNLKLIEVKLSSTGRLNFSSEAAIGDRAYIFDGQVMPSKIVGTFHIAQNQVLGTQKVNNAEVVLRKLETRILNKKAIKNVSGLYSNVRYNEEGGDLTGEDLIIVPLERSISAIFVSYENEMLPYAAEVTAFSRNELKFKIHKENEVESYVGTFSGKKIILRRRSTTPNNGLALLRRDGLLGILTKGNSIQAR